MINNILDPSLENCTSLEAIICMNPSEFRDVLSEQLLDMECKVYLAKSPTDAFTKLQIHLFHIVIMEVNYSMEAIQLLSWLPSAVRRNIFYVLVGDIFETDNHIQSYVLSANLVIHPSDISYSGQILQNAVIEYNYFYRSFYYALQATRQNIG